MIWLTIDIEQVTDMNFHVKWKDEPNINYEEYLDSFIELSRGQKATAFVLGSFAKKYPQLVEKVHKANIEIACHGFYHNLVYKEDFSVWAEELLRAKNLLEEIIGEKVYGYRSPSWSMPFEKRYYEYLAKIGLTYASSYFPMKNYMYGNSVNKKTPFYIYTEFGKIQERPIVKNIIPFSGGFYLRVLPTWLLKFLFNKTKSPILYVHPYELMETNLLKYFLQHASINIDYVLAFYASRYAKKKIEDILREK